jgi:hypothetical protein
VDRLDAATVLAQRTLRDARAVAAELWPMCDEFRPRIID